MKVLLVSAQFPPLEAGVPNFYFNLSKRLSSNEFSVLTSQISGFEKIDHQLRYNVYRTKYLNKYKLSYSAAFILRHIPILFLLLKIIKKEKVDVVIIGECRLFLMALALVITKLTRVPFIVFHHGDGVPSFTLKSDRYVGYFVRKSAGVIANSEFTKRRLVKKYAKSEKEIWVLHPGVEAEYFRPSLDTDYLCSRHALWDKKVILTVGRLDERKGHDNVIRALPKIAEHIPNVVYLVVGEGDDKPRLEKLIVDLELRDRVIFTGAVQKSDLPGYYNLCDLYVMANREIEDGDTEGFGMVFLEASACEKAVVAGASGGAVEAVADGVSGLVVDSFDPKAISQAVIDLIGDDGKRRQMEIAGRERVLKQFTWEAKEGEFRSIVENIALATARN